MPQAFPVTFPIRHDNYPTKLGATVLVANLGGTTPQTLYTDAGGSTTTANPFTAPKYGEVTVFVASGNYTITVTQAVETMEVTVGSATP